MNNIVAVVIPVYKEVLTNEEVFSLRLGLSVLNKHPVVFVSPKSLNTSYYERTCGEFNISAEFTRFKDDYFTDIASYNLLLLQPEFYSKFLDFKYILIYQLDALVFKNTLLEWCAKGYDYLGAPWFKESSDLTEEPELQKVSGNGGFSLRKVKSTFELLTLAKKTPFNKLKSKEYKQQNRWFKALLARVKSSRPILDIIIEEGTQEDIALTHYLPRFFDSYNIANADVAMFFSFEEYPEKLYELTGNILPFGCHAFPKYNFKFWKNHLINLNLWEDFFSGYKF